MKRRLFNNPDFFKLLICNIRTLSVVFEVREKTTELRVSSRNINAAVTVHSFSKPGHYTVSVERTDESQIKAVTRLHVVVE